MNRIIKFFYFFKCVCQFTFIFFIIESTITVETVPVDISFCSFSINVPTIVNIKTAVIVLRIVSTIFPGTTIVSCLFHYDSPPFFENFPERDFDSEADSWLLLASSNTQY